MMIMMLTMVMTMNLKFNNHSKNKNKIFKLFSKLIFSMLSPLLEKTKIKKLFLLWKIFIKLLMSITLKAIKWKFKISFFIFMFRIKTSMISRIHYKKYQNWVRKKILPKILSEVLFKFFKLSKEKFINRTGLS